MSVPWRYRGRPYLLIQETAAQTFTVQAGVPYRQTGPLATVRTFQAALSAVRRLQRERALGPCDIWFRSAAGRIARVRSIV